MMSASVRGMGVADMTSRCGRVPLPTSAARCSTPKRCCSSVTTRARFLNSTSSESSACVPTQSPVSPEARPASTSRRSLARMEPVSFATLMPKGSRKPESVAKCCSASISVGAMKAD